MPWLIVNKGNRYQVVAEDTGKVAGTHPTRAMATAQLRALYANYKKKK